MGIKEDRETLLKAAGGWNGVGAEVSRAKGLVTVGEDGGFAFGGLAVLAGIDAAHNEFITDMVAALHKGNQTMTDIAQALIDTAKDFGATDTTVADTFHNPDGTPK